MRNVMVMKFPTQDEACAVPTGNIDNHVPKRR